MPDVGINNTPLSPSSAYAWDGTTWQKLLADTAGRLLVSQYPMGGSLADGQLAAAEADLYTVPAGKAAVIDQLWLYNTHAATTYTATVAIQRSGGTSRIVARLALAAGDGVCLTIGPLSAGDKIRGLAGAATTVNYEVLGREV